MNKDVLTTIHFHGASLIVWRGDTPETTLVAMKPFVEGMGLSWSAQFVKLKNHPVLGKGISEFEIPSAGGHQKMTALPLNRLHFWLATIQPNKLKCAIIRERVVLYQTEAADALFNHFFGARLAQGQGEVIEFGGDARKVLGGIVKRVVHKEITDVFQAMFEQALTAKLAEQNMMVRYGKTAGQIWDSERLPKLKSGAVWLGYRLAEMGCLVNGGERAEIGGRVVRLFDPDKSAICMKNGLLSLVLAYIERRKGQMSLFSTRKERSAGHRLLQ